MLPATSYRPVSVFLVLVMVVIVLCGCQPASKEAVGVVEGEDSKGKKMGLPCQLPAAKAENSAASRYPIRLAIDGSASMAGFVKNSASRYNQVMELIDNITLNANPTYSRVDENVKKIDRAGFQQAKTSAFYTGKTNKIADALESAAPKGEDITIIVTDLQQDDGDTKQATKKLVDNYLQLPGYGVALWGFKSEFDGLVYPPSGAPYPYQAKNLDTGHPFYVLMVGKTEHLNNFMRQFRSQGSAVLGDPHHLVSVFSPDGLVEEVAYLNGKPKAMPKDLSTPSSLLLNGVTMKKGNQPMELLELGGRATGIAKLDYSLASKKTADLASTWITQVTTTIKKYDDGQTGFVVDRTIKAFQGQHSMTDQSVELALAIDTDALKSGLYYVTTDVQVTGIKTPAQWSAWHDPGQNNGAKTARLKEFLDSLAVGVSSLTQAKPVTIARLCHGIQKN